MLNKVVLIVCVLAFVSSYEVTVEKTANGFVIHPKDANKTNSLSPRIIGGKEVTPHQYPFQAALLMYKGDSIFFCGGTLITNQWVLTAATCVGVKPDLIVVLLGAHDLQNLDINTVQLYNATQYKHHSEWNGVTFQNDVGLVRLPSDATLNKYVNVVELAKGTDKYEGKEAITLGWGQTETEGMSFVLKEETSKIITNEDCTKANDNYKDVIKSIHVCISGEGPKGICSGDAGGPLLVDGVQVGIASFSTIDCSAGLPSVFTRETDFHDWINENLTDEGFDDHDDDDDDGSGDDDGGDDDNGDDDDNDDGGANTHSLHFVAIISAALLCFVRLFSLM